MRERIRRTVAVVARVSLPTSLLLAAVTIQSQIRTLDSVAALPVAHTIPGRIDPAHQTVDQVRALRETTAERTVRSGETLSQTFHGLGLAPEDSQAATAAATRYLDPKRLRVGDRYRVYYRGDTQVTGVEFAVGGRGDLRVQRVADRWDALWRPYVRDVQTRTLAGEVSGGLESSIRAVGGEPALAGRMADVLQWDLDFNRDLRKGDRFEVLYEEVLLDGKPNGFGNVLALAYQTANKRFEAYRYGDGYYDGDGRPLRKMFLKSPLPYSRVTSGFTTRRFHPVLKIYRPHLGVDLGAPAGTPVRVTASGTVLSAGWDGGGGKTVKVRHPGGYVTAYLHLSRYAQGIRAGTRVGQGDLVGYVGSTGLATAAHLDYRVQKSGKWLNPMAIGGVAAEPIAKADAGSFRAWRDSLRVSLASGAPLPPNAPAPGAEVLSRMAAVSKPGPAATVARR